MMPIEEDLVRSVASKINYYIDVKQREDGFNLSGSPLRSRKPLYIPIPPQGQRFSGSSSSKRNRFSIYSALQEQPSILVKRRQRSQNLSSYIPLVLGNSKREKIVQTASKFLVSLQGFYNNDSPRRRRKKINTESKSDYKLPSINDRKNYQDFIYDDAGSFNKDDIYFDYGKKSPDPSPTPTPVVSTQPPDSLLESLNSTLTPKEEVKPTYSISYSADPTPEAETVLMHCATQTESDNILKQGYPPTNVDQEYAEIKSGKETEYIVVLKTGNVLGASTRAQVKIVLCGSEGKTGALVLLKSETNKIKFQKGKEDHFILKTFNVGHLEKIRIGHDRPELPYAWFLDHVTVFDQTEKWMYMFPSGQWFSGVDGDRQTYRELLLEKNMAMVEDIQNVSEEDLLQRLARTENYDEKNKEKDPIKETAPDKIQPEIHLNATPDTSRSDLSTLSSDGSNIENRFNQGTVICVQNQVTVGTQTNKLPNKPYNLARDFHQPLQNDCPMERSDQNISESESTSSRKTSLKDDGDDDEPKEKADGENHTFGGNNESKNNQLTSKNLEKSASSEDDFYAND